MFIYFVVPAMFFGVFAAFWIIGYAMVSIECPYERVAFLLTILATEVVALALATFLLPPLAAQVLFTFSLTKSAIWCIMNHRNVVHFQLPKE